MLTYYLSLIDDEPSRTLFEQLYQLYVHTMFHVAHGILQDHMLAEDAVHDAFLRILNHLDKIRG
jgi:RNA polymerase sigma-70 factor (ECF subfamily)